MKAKDLDKAVYDLIAAGTRQRAGIRVALKYAVTAADITMSIQRLRYAGRIKLDKMEVNQVEAPISYPELTPASTIAAGLVAAAVKAEATASGDRRRLARNTGTVAKPLDLSPAERVVSLYLEQPEDLFAFLRDQWPGLLSEVILQARAVNATPVQHLVAVIERGLDADRKVAA